MSDRELRDQLEGLFSDLLKEPLGVEESRPAFLEYAVEDITEGRRVEEALQQRGAILGAVALAAEKFLRPGDLEQDIRVVLASLAQAANVNRTSIWEASTSEDGHYLISVRYEWIAPEARLTPLVGLQNLPMFRRWGDLLPYGEIIVGHVRDFSDKEQDFFVPRGIKSLLAVPIFVGGAWWGFMGFDQGETEREWAEAEIEALKTAANILGGALESKATEEALRVSEERFALAVQGANDGIWDWDIQNNSLYWSPRFKELLGYAPDELEVDFNTFESHLHPDDREPIQAAIEAHLKERVPYNVEQRLRTKSGEYRWFNARGQAVWDEDGRPIRMVGAGTDITERKRAEEALRVSEERFALAVQGANDGIWDWDIQNNSLYWSPRLKELLGYAPDELEVDFNTFELHLHPDDREPIQAAIEAHLKERVPYNVEQRLRTKSGEYRWFNARGQAVWDEDGRPIRMVGASTDITERKRAEAERERLLADLERRAIQLQTAAEVSRAASSILDPQELLSQTVELIADRFNLYYAGLFLVDETGEWAVLRAGTGEAGRQMLEAGHKLEVGGVSMVGWCTANAQARIALDVGKEAVRFDNPLLPDTRSEMALPLISRGRVLGALDVQSVEREAFSQEDITVLQTMADQVAVAIDNAQLFTETQAALEEMEASQRRYVREQWAEFVPARVAPHYERTQPGVPPLGDAVLPEDLGELGQAVEQAMARREIVVQSSTDDGEGEAPLTGSSTGSPRSSGQAALVVPISLRGEVIGALGLHETESKRQWTDDEVALIEAVAEQMALAIENARLFEQTQRSAARDRLLAEITARVRSSLDPQTILQTAVRELGAALSTDRAFVRLGTGTPAQSVTPVAKGQEASSEKQEP